MSEAYEVEFEECLINGTTTYKCLICVETFNELQLLVDHHYELHVNKKGDTTSVPKDVRITTVSKDINNTSDLKDVNTASVPKDIIFVNSENQVVDEHAPRFVYKCRLCTIEVSKLDDMTNHIESEHNGEVFVTIDDERMCTSVYKCVACSYEFARLPEMNQHISSVHKITEFQCCKICSGYFPKADFNHHRSVHFTKPNMSFAQLIAEALLTAPDRMLALKDIYIAINNKHPYYSLDETQNCRAWQNTLRHTLTLNKGFIKMDRPPPVIPYGQHKPRGAEWKLKDGAEIEIFKPSRRSYKAKLEAMQKPKPECSKCNVTFKSEMSLNAHICNNFQCLRCPKRFRTEIQLSKHFEDTHERNKPNLYPVEKVMDNNQIIIKCPKCNVTFKSEMSLNSHMCIFKLASKFYNGPSKSFESKPVCIEPKPMSIEPKPGSIEPKPVSIEPKPVSIELIPVSNEPKPVSLPTTHQGPLEEVKVNNHYKCSKCNVTFNSDAAINFHMSSNFQCFQYTLSLLKNEKKKNISKTFAYSHGEVQTFSFNFE